MYVRGVRGWRMGRGANGLYIPVCKSEKKTSSRRGDGQEVTRNAAHNVPIHELQIRVHSCNTSWLYGLPT